MWCSRAFHTELKAVLPVPAVTMNCKPMHFLCDFSQLILFFTLFLHLFWFPHGFLVFSLLYCSDVLLTAPVLSISFPKEVRALPQEYVQPWEGPRFLLCS